MPFQRAQVNQTAFNQAAALPYAMRFADLSIAMDDIYETLYSVNSGLLGRGLPRLEESLRGANFTAFLSDLMVVAMARHAMGLAQNTFPNGHPDLLPTGRFPNDGALSAEDGVEIKVTKRATPAVDMHGARGAWYCVFRYVVDDETQPLIDRAPTRFTNVWLAQLGDGDFRDNPRQSALSTRTSSPNRQGVAKLRAGWIYQEPQVAADPAV